MEKPYPFFWYELMTSDTQDAERFYAAVVGWDIKPFPGSDRGYNVLEAHGQGVGGIMPIPAEARGMPPCWVGYVGVPDVDAAADSIKAAGGKVWKGPEDIPNVGRFAVVGDPQGAMFNLLRPSSPAPDMPPPAPRTPGTTGWHELYTSDEKAGFDFYADQLGWHEVRTMDMGPMGTYRLFGWDDSENGNGGMMNHPQPGSPPSWLFYFWVDDIDTAADRVREAGGEVLMGPMEVPDGSWVLQGNDPQGARFALVARKG